MNLLPPDADGAIHQVSGQVERETRSFSTFISKSCVHVVQNVRTAVAKKLETFSQQKQEEQEQEQKQQQQQQQKQQ